MKPRPEITPAHLKFFRKSFGLKQAEAAEIVRFREKWATVLSGGANEIE